MTETLTPPSSLRIPVTILTALLSPPLAPVAWIALSGSDRRRYLRSGWVRAGGLVFVLAALPLLAVGLAAKLGLWPDPNPNPVGLGLLMVAGALVADLLVVIGIFLVGRGR